MDYSNVTPLITPIGITDYRGEERRFGIKADDRRRHVYVIGKTGVGKSTLLENMIVSDIQSGKGIGVVDPHGELAEHILHYVPEERVEDVIYFDAGDLEHPIGFNPFEEVSVERRHLLASGMMGVFKKIWPDVWSARMEYILSNTVLALLENPSSTVLGILRMFSDRRYRDEIVNHIEDPVVKHFWKEEFAQYTQRLQIEAVAAIQNKVGQFVTNPLLRNILGQPRSAIDMREVMDSGKILIVNLSKGQVGEDNTALLGSLIVTKLQLAAMSRGDMPLHELRDFVLYVDEFQNFATDSFANILSEARKYRLNLVLAHQYINQLVHDNGNTRVRDAIFGNVGTLVCFRIGAADAEFLEPEFGPQYTAQDLVNLAKHHVIIKMMIDGITSQPFSARTFPPPTPPEHSQKETIVEYSQRRYGSPRSYVEEKLRAEWQDERLAVERVSERGEQRLKTVLHREDEGRPAPLHPHAGEKPPRGDVNVEELKDILERALGGNGEAKKD